MAGASCAIRGTFFDFIDDPWKHIGHEQDAARFIRDGLLVVKDGIIEDFGTFADVSRRHPDLPVTHLQNRLILPGFIDGHIHFPQVRVLGAYGAQLLDWLQTWIFPEEAEVPATATTRAPLPGTSSTPCSPGARRPAWHSPPAARSRRRSSSTRRPGATCA